MWPSLIWKAKQGGIDVIDTYVFWNLHEPQQGQYDFSGRHDIVEFIKEVQAQGLYVCLRIGPFIEEQFYMKNFTTKIVDLMKSEKLYASQGGPIILSQIENEYQNVERAFHDKGPPYVLWAAKMAVGLKTGVPWIMCKQDDAPDPVINTCNGIRCGETFSGPNSANKPALWTENWTHFYYDPAPLDEYGLITQPKWGHLQELHAAVKLCSYTLLYGSRNITSLGALQDVSTQSNTRTRQPAVKLDSAEKWEEYNEIIPIFEDTSMRSDFLLEQMSTTKDTSDYLWYTTSYEQTEDSEQVITVKSRGHALRAFVNGELVGAGHGFFRNTDFTFETKIDLKSGINNISLLSIMVGLPDSGAYMERRAAGLESVSIQSNRVVENMRANFQWGYQVGLLGEKSQIYTEEGSKHTCWSKLSNYSRPLKWYKTKFDAPDGPDPVALNLATMGKGEAWKNMVIFRWLVATALAAALCIVSGRHVSYDGRSLMIDGQRKLFFSGSIHYPRSTPDMWPSLISKAKSGGLNAIDTYVFWNLHEPQPGQYDFRGRHDIIRFIKEVEAQGLYVCLRIGPFIESEWSYGGLPFWLHDVPNIVFRSDNGPFKINACNGFRCGETFVGPNSAKKPAIWTENWTHFYDLYGSITKIRAVEDIAYQVALFIVKMNGSFINYYMAYVYSRKKGECAAFLVNTNSRHNADVQFRNRTYQIPRHSISILPDCKTVVFNTAKVSARNNNTRTRQPVVKLDSPQKWEEYDEVIPVFDDTSLRSHLLLEQMKTTKDKTDYLWYTASYQQDKQSQAVINVTSRGHVLRAFVNGALIGSGHGTKRNTNFRFETKIALKGGVNNISLLSSMVGLPDSGAFMERSAAGVETVSIHNDRALEKNLMTNNQWGYQVGLLGERLQIYTEKGSIQAQWRKFNPSSKTLKWYKTTFDALEGSNPVALNLGTMGKGEAWINGQSIGRYWISFLTPAGTPSQIWYHLPRSFLRPTGNLLVLFEEEIGNPLGITVDTI
ncbi:beta-galactosidase [Striga asiatica]|uniref:Beta-galactosidase n=1 Tax=Striga asiatica TaxID=4170 RepID=A0A5A7QV88_STRAF|nr:beta-galactosidase [Striga asiatica]